MSDFVFVYRAPTDYQGSLATAAAWKRWFESLNTSLLDKGNPVFVRSTHGNGGPTPGLVVTP